MISRFQTVYPVSELLKQYVYCFYVYESDSAAEVSVHYSFPHTYNAVSIYCGARIACSDEAIVACGDDTAPPCCVLQGKRQYPLRVVLEGAFKRVTIIFKPLGLNHFINIPLGEVLGPAPTLFQCWDSTAFDTLTAALFGSDALPAQLAHLESFLLQAYQQPALHQLAKALQYLEDVDDERPVQEIAALVGLPLRTFNRLFLLHLGVSPVAHRRIARFRQALEIKLFRDKLSRLTAISYQHNFYDQSDFIKLFRQFTGANPKALFNKVDQLGDSNLVFQFVPPTVG